MKVFHNGCQEIVRKEKLSKVYQASLDNKYTNHEAVAQRYSAEKVFLEISQNSQGNTCARVSFLITLQASRLQLH